ncbi:hypothetical protein GGI25_004395 [Coemansia spiralis]|uniref:Uncharacterized protein n=2 Tax=Coemansia TaxID=4863 RepID=A0A9W8G4Y1_9FUNG|nr:ribonuclease H2 non-catalytic subunit-domain-containing protein [Coemansia spiralis]KAJ1995346.1 hypothetical protein EDC05_000898 [Coemansia umbellata]KAJ2624827.1 hypothetical protein GGI26_001243 [Coemansia sp. RSA 1358]KAJ2674374.1 hypothetical protein GGI25_004395 [Coemansia spiralis]
MTSEDSGSNVRSVRDIVNLETDQENKPEHLHLLPCAISYDGPAKAATYFIPEKKPDSTYEASFRGRQLCGRKITLPRSYIGHVVIESMPHGLSELAFENDVSDTASDQRELRSVAQIAGLTVWEHDTAPLENDDEFICALEWIDTAASIHADCTSEETNGAVIVEE